MSYHINLDLDISTDVNTQVKIIHQTLDDTFYNLCRIKLLVFILLYIIYMDISYVGEISKVKSEKEKKLEEVLDLKKEYKLIDLRIKKIFRDNLDEYVKIKIFIEYFNPLNPIILDFIIIRYVYSVIGLDNKKYFKNNETIDKYISFSYINITDEYNKDKIVNIVKLSLKLIILGVNVQKIINRTDFQKSFSKTTDLRKKWDLIEKFINDKNQIIDMFKKIIIDNKYDSILYEVKYKNLQILFNIFLDIVNTTNNISNLFNTLNKSSSVVNGNGGRALQHIIDDIGKMNKKDMETRYGQITKKYENIKDVINTFNEQLKTKKISDYELSEFINKKNKINEDIEKLDTDAKSFLTHYQSRLESIIWG